MATPLTGDIKNRVEKPYAGVTLHNFPQVLAANLADATSVINDYAQSGKRLGAQVMAVDSLEEATSATVYTASGTGATATWKKGLQVLGTGAADVTPE